MEIFFPGGGRWVGGGPCPEILRPSSSPPSPPLVHFLDPCLELLGPKFVFWTHVWSFGVQKLFSGPLFGHMSGAYGSKACFPIWAQGPGSHGAHVFRYGPGSHGAQGAQTSKIPKSQNPQIQKSLNPKIPESQNPRIQESKHSVLTPSLC